MQWKVEKNSNDFVEYLHDIVGNEYENQSTYRNIWKWRVKKLLAVLLWRKAFLLLLSIYEVVVHITERQQYKIASVCVWVTISKCNSNQ